MVIQRTRAGGDHRATLQDLLRWRRSVCDGRPDWQNAWIHTNTSPTLTLKNKTSMTKKASP
ncbi:putative unconventional myosin-XVI [Triplophysa rosa]|uniref:Unconventional myosin-XVI n=1 Tax=Triplophysa rosa TaxID=992332 RepID=A0A9W7WUM5_TRIRA|nr:putative unconventional myosin-XVI [Triplophysa rosa]